VLVALVIVAIGMAALMGTLSSAADSASYLRDKTFASWIAMNRISEVRLAARRPAKGTSSGEVQFAGRSWRYDQEVVETDVPGMLRIDVRVQPAIGAAAKPSRTKGKPAYTSMASGVVGDAVLAPTGVEPDWNGVPFPGEPDGDGDGDGDGTKPPGDGTPQPTPTPPGDNRT